MTALAPRIAIAVAVSLMLAGALYLYAVRGEALLMDMSTLVRGVFCL